LFSAVVALVALGVFSVTWPAEFVKWDDDINITRNTRIQNLTRENLTWMFTDVGLARRYMPLGWMGFAVHHATFGLNASSYHVVNTILHSACAVLLFYILANILRRVVVDSEVGETRISICAALGSLIWAVHPLRVEVVAWSSGRLYLQATLFLLLSLAAYLRSQTSQASGRHVFYWISVFGFAASAASEGNRALAGSVS
jgi:hypothetical protein